MIATAAGEQSRAGQQTTGEDYVHRKEVGMMTAAVGRTGEAPRDADNPRGE